MGLLPDLKKFEDAIEGLDEKQDQFLGLLTEVRDLLKGIKDELVYARPQPVSVPLPTPPRQVWPYPQNPVRYGSET